MGISRSEILMESKDPFQLRMATESARRSNEGQLARIPLEAVGSAKVKGVLRLRKPIRWANRFTALRMTCGLA
jgi:hypothetical protein